MSIPRTRILSDAELGACEPWRLPPMDGPLTERSAPEAPPEPPTAQAIEAIFQQAYEEGFALGRKEGKEQAHRESREEWERRTQHLRQIFDHLAAPLRALDEEVERSLAELSMLIARHLVRRELKTNPGEIVAVVREAVALLPLTARKPRIYLHPEDVEWVRTAFSLGEEERAWRLDPDPRVARGGCLVETESSFIDATIEGRLNALIVRMFGGEREDDR